MVTTLRRLLERGVGCNESHRKYTYDMLHDIFRLLEELP